MGSRNEHTTSTVEQGLIDAHAEIEALRDEMAEWADGLAGAGMDHLEKFQDIEDTHGELDQAADEMGELLETDGGGLDLFPQALLLLPITFTQDTRKRATARHHRLTNALMMANAAVDALEEALGGLDWDTLGQGSQAHIDIPKIHECQDDAAGLVEAYRAGIDAIQSTTFPGMY